MVFNFIVNAILFLIICGLGECLPITWEDIFRTLFITLLVLYIITKFLLFLIKKRNIEKKEIIDDIQEKIKELAKKYIKERLSGKSLTYDDYKKFSEMVQIEYNINVPNERNLEVPVCIRDSLYFARIYHSNN